MEIYGNSIFTLCLLPIPGGGDEGRNGFGGPPGGGQSAGNELGIDLSGEIWVETPADGGNNFLYVREYVLIILVPSNAINSVMKLIFDIFLSDDIFLGIKVINTVSKGKGLLMFLYHEKSCLEYSNVLI